MIEIQEIKKIRGENTDNYVINVGKHLEIKLTLDDIEVSHRLSNHEKSGIIVNFTNCCKSSNWYQ